MNVAVQVGFRRAPWGEIASRGPAAAFQQNRGIVTGGQGVRIWDDVMGTELLLSLPGVAGNYASTPDSPAVSITGDIDVRVRVAMADWTPAATNTLLAKFLTTGNQRAYGINILNTGVVQAIWSANGTASITRNSTVAPTVADGAGLWLRYTLDVDDGAGNHVVTFYTAPNAASPSSWTQLGDPVVTAGTTSILDSSAVLQVSNFDGAGGTQSLNGAVYRAQIYNGIDGTLAAEFYPDRDATLGAASFASSTTGETWTVNATSTALAAAIHHGNALKQGVDGSRPSAEADGSILFPGVDEFLRTSAFTLSQPFSICWVGQQVSWTNGDHILNGVAANTAVFQTSVSPNLAIFAGSSTGANTGLAVGVYGVLSAVFNGASSLLQVNNGTPSSGDAGANNAGGITMGAINAGTAGWSHTQARNAAIFPSALSAGARFRVVRALARMSSIAA